MATLSGILSPPLSSANSFLPPERCAVARWLFEMDSGSEDGLRAASRLPRRKANLSAVQRLRTDLERFEFDSGSLSSRRGGPLKFPITIILRKTRAAPSSRFAGAASIRDTVIRDSFGPAMHTVRILGLDPGLGRMGWGVIDCTGTKLSHVAHGVIVTKPAECLGLRLLALHTEVARIIAELQPGAIAVEQAFVHKDPSAALKLGHARAVALLAAAQAGLDIAEYAPNHIKKSVVGAGHAGKEQVMAMVKRLLPACGVEQADAADALAAAIAHAALAGTRARIMAALQ